VAHAAGGVTTLGTTHTLSEVADRVGYGSETALSRAFKRLVGVSPSAWREGVRPDLAFVSGDDGEADATGEHAAGISP